MSIMIEVYVIVCVLLLLFDIGFLVVKNIKTHKFYPKNTAFEKQIISEVANHRNNGCFSEGFEQNLQKKLKTTKQLITLQKTLETDSEAADWFRDCIFAQIDAYQKKNDYEQAYYTYVISLFDYSQMKVPVEFSNKFLSFLDSKSLYTFSNTMMAFYKFGEENLLLLALDIVDKRKGFYHKKLLVDGLLSCESNFENLNTKLLERFDRYSTYTKDCLLDYLRMTGYDVSELCLRLLQNCNTDTQLQYSAMRYFAKYPNVDSKRFFLDIMNDDKADWIKQMLAIKALLPYKENEVWNAVWSKITSSNWFIRVNAADFLYNNGLSRGDVFDILFLRDKYANDVLLYQFRNDKEMSRYIIDTIQLLAEQDELAALSKNIEHVEKQIAFV